MTTKASDTQVDGTHYKDMGDFQPWDVLRHWLTPEEYRGYQKGVAIAYLARERAKGGDKDIAKAAHHLQKMLEVIGDGKEKAEDDDNLPLGDGWIKWNGGECPVPSDAQIEYALRNGEISSILAPDELHWTHQDHPGDIVAYRVIK